MGQSPRPDESIVTDQSSEVDRAIDPGLHVVAYDGAEFVSAGILSVNYHIFLVQSQIGDLGPRTQVTILSDDAVPHIA